MASAAATALSEFLTSLPIDPKLDKDCQSQDKDEVTVLGQFGKRTASGLYCEQDGFRAKKSLTTTGRGTQSDAAPFARPTVSPSPNPSLEGRGIRRA